MHLFIFFTIMIFVMLTFHWIVSGSLLYFFNIKNKKHQIAIHLSFIILAFNLMANFFLSLYFNNLLIKILNWLAVYWFGILINAIWICMLSWVIFLVLNRFKKAINKQIFAWCILGLTIITSIYGIYNYHVIDIKYHNIKINNLPKTWQGKTAVHLSDIHLGSINGADYLQDIVKQVNAQNPDIVFITGDLFDGFLGDISEVIKPIAGLNPPLGVYFVLGNHEVFYNNELVLDTLKQTHIKMLNDELIDVEGLTLVGMDYKRGRKLSELNNFFAQIDPDAPSVLLLHEPLLTNFAQSAGVDLQLGGHTHCGQLFPFNLLTRFVYGKYHKGLHSEGDYNINTSCGVGGWGTPMRTWGDGEVIIFRFE